MHAGILCSCVYGYWIFLKKPSYFESPFLPLSLSWVLLLLHYVSFSRNNNSKNTEIGEKASHVVCVTSGNSKDGCKTTELFIIPTEINTVCKSSGRNITQPLIFIFPSIFINGSCLSPHHHSSKIICLYTWVYLSIFHMCTGYYLIMILSFIKKMCKK